VEPGPARPGDAFDVPGIAFYAEHVSGGQVDPATGQFVFHVTNGHLVRDGVVSEPVAETTVSGYGPQVLLDIDVVADDIASGAAKCGKAGQWVQVGLRQPTLRVRRLLVGGTAR
jgi:TldD protein